MGDCLKDVSSEIMGKSLVGLGVSLVKISLKESGLGFWGVLLSKE